MLRGIDAWVNNVISDMLVTGPTPQADESGEASEEEADVEPPLKKPRLLF